MESYIVLSPKLLSSLKDTTIVCHADFVRFKTQNAADVVKLVELGYPMTGTSDGWCFLEIPYEMEKTIRLGE